MSLSNMEDLQKRRPFIYTHLAPAWVLHLSAERLETSGCEQLLPQLTPSFVVRSATCAFKQDAQHHLQPAKGS